MVSALVMISPVGRDRRRAGRPEPGRARSSWPRTRHGSTAWDATRQPLFPGGPRRWLTTAALRRSRAPAPPVAFTATSADSRPRTPRRRSSMTVSDELAYATATELAARIRRRDLSPVELLDAVIARIEARNPSLNAFVFTAFDEARERARQ